MNLNFKSCHFEHETKILKGPKIVQIQVQYVVSNHLEIDRLISMLNVVIFCQVTLVAGAFLKGEDYTCCRHNCNFKLSKARASPTVDSQNRGKCQLLQPSTIRGNYRA